MKKPKLKETIRTTENLLVRWESLAEAACEYHNEASYDNGQILRTAAREYVELADALEGKS